MSRGRKPPPIEELLCDGNLSNTDILPELQQVQDDDSIRVQLMSSEAGRQALAQRLNQGSEECQAIAAAEDAAEQTELLEAHLSALGLLAALMPNKPGDKLARVLLHGSKLLDGFDAVLSCISKLCQECSAWPSIPAVEQLLSAVGQAGRDVLSVVQDIACYEYKATVATQGTQLGGTQNGKTSTVFGREQCGDILMGSILGLATMDTSLSKTFYALRRSAVLSLVAICACSRRCQATMVQSHTEAYNTLMGEMLAGCGDAYTQVDIFELMYRCGKAFSERAYRQHLDAQMRGKFAKLLAMDAKDIGDLSAALHGLVLDYNNSIQDPSVQHITANKVQILSPLQQALVAQGSEVSLGSRHLALDVLAVDEDGTHNELCDIDYSNVLRVLVTSVNGSDNNTQMQMQVQVDVQCKSFPRSLGTMLEESAREQAGGKSPWFRLGMLLQSAEGDRLLKLLRAHGVTVVSQSNNVLEPSQQDAKPRKVSMGNMPLSYKPKKPLNLTKTTPATDNRVKPLALTFKTPQTAPPAAAAAEAAEEAAAADDDDDLAADSDQQHPSPEFGTTAAGKAAAAAPAADLAAETPAAAAADGAAGGRESQMLQALLETAEQMPTTHARSRPTLSSSLMAGASPEPPAKRAAAAEEQGEGAEGTGDEEEGVAGAVKETAPAAAVGAAGGANRQQQQTGGSKGKQQQQREQEKQQGKARGADSVSWDAAADEEVGAEGGGEVQQDEDNLHSNSQELALEASPAAAVKARRRNNKAAAAAELPAAADSKRKGAGKQAVANTAKPEPARRAAAGAAAKPPAGASKPPAGMGRNAAERKAPANGLQLERRSKRQQAAKETQDPIQDPDLPSLQPPAPAARTAPPPPPAAAAAAGEGASPDMPAWFNTSAAAGKGAGAAASAPVSKVTTPYSSRNAQKAASAAAAAAAEGEDAPAAAAASPTSGGRKKAGRLAKLGATPQGKGQPPAAAEATGAGDLYAFPEEAGAEAAAADARRGKGQKGRQGAAAKGRKTAAAADKAAEMPQQQQQQQQLSDFDFPASDSEGEGDDVNDIDAKVGKGGRGRKAGRGGRGGRGKGRGAAAAKAGRKRKAASAAEGDTAAAGNKQKQQRKGAAAAAAAADDDGGAEQQHELGDVVFGTVDDDIIPASDMLNLNLDSQPDETAAAAAGASPAAGRREPRASRASKSKALEAMQQQQKLLDQPTQAEPQLFEDDREFGDLRPLDLQADFDQHNEEVLGGNDGDEFAGLGAVGPQSPGAHSGSGARAGDASDSDDSGEMGRMQALLQGAAGKRGTEHSRQLARLLQGRRGTAAAAAAAETPDADKIHTAQVRRKLPLTAAATKAAAANRRKPAAAAAAAAGSPLGVPAAGKRRAGAAAEGALGGFQLPGLGSDEPLSSPSDLGAAGAHDPATGFNLGLTHRRKPGKGFGGLKGLNLSPADVGGGSSDSDEDAAAGAATRFGGLREGAGRKQQQQQRRGGFAGVGREEDAGQLEEGTEEQMAAVVDTLARTFRGVDDDSDTDSDDDEIPLESQMKQMLMAIFKHRQQTDKKKTEKDIQDLQARLQEQMAEYQAELKKEFNTLAIKGDAQADKYLSQLEKKAAELQALQERQRLELEQQWEEYKAVYVKAAGMYQALSAARERGVSVHKRKLAELQQNVLGQIAEKEAQLTAKKARVGSNFKQTIMLLQAAAAQ